MSILELFREIENHRSSSEQVQAFPNRWGGSIFATFHKNEQRKCEKIAVITSAVHSTIWVDFYFGCLTTRLDDAVGV